MRKLYIKAIFLLFVLVSCNRAARPVSTPNVSSKDSIQLHKLLAGDYDYYIHMDSLPANVQWLRQAATRYKNDTLAFYADLFNLNYLYQAGDYVTGMDAGLKVLDEAQKLKVKKRLPE